MRPPVQAAFFMSSCLPPFDLRFASPKAHRALREAPATDFHLALQLNASIDGKTRMLPCLLSMASGRIVRRFGCNTEIHLVQSRPGNTALRVFVAGEALAAYHRAAPRKSSLLIRQETEPSPHGSVGGVLFWRAAFEQKATSRFEV